ncbi:MULTISPECIES: winged helix DNA-binding domain-containing protein [Streptomyces]|uniref:winged helix DNA-binding domain-containing protein n=1 Tax=Streptomyces diastaticus TaxID=1956 RepID=UPI003652397A
MTDGQRRARLGVRHALAPSARADGPAGAARAVVALHSTDPSSVHVAAWARTRDEQADAASVEHALYEDRALVRLLAMRRTVFVAPAETAAVLQAACSREVAARERRKLEGFVAASELAPDGAAAGWLAGAEEAALASLAARGEATAAELAADDARLAAQVRIGGASPHARGQSVAARLLLLLAAEGKAVRGRPRGSWTSHQYRWSPLSAWLPDGLAPWETEAARAELARLWLRAYGPGTAEDLRWWAGWTKTQTTRALKEVASAEVELDDGRTGLVLADDLDPVPGPEPWAALLPALDPTPMGWHSRAWYLGPHRDRLYDRAGNIGPSVWWCGRIVGGWAQDRDGALVCRYLEDVGADARAAVDAEAERLAPRLGAVRLTARTRGRTWLEEELAADSG